MAITHSHREAVEIIIDFLTETMYEFPQEEQGWREAEIKAFQETTSIQQLILLWEESEISQDTLEEFLEDYH